MHVFIARPSNMDNQSSSSSSSSETTSKETVIDKSEEEEEEDDSEAESPYTLHQLGQHGMVRVRPSEERDTVRRLFLRGMGGLSGRTVVVSVHKNKAQPSSAMQARRDSFRAHATAMAHNRRGHATFADAWFGASPHHIFSIVRSGFAFASGRPVHLSPINFSLHSALNTEVDEGGVRHVLLCRVALGKMEQLRSESRQILPSSNEFDSGVDCLSSPTKYTIWSPFINTRIYPHYIVTFTTSGLDGLRTRRPESPDSQWNAFYLLIRSVAKFFDRETMTLVVQSYNDFQANKITRPQLIQRMRNEDMILQNPEQLYSGPAIRTRAKQFKQELQNLIIKLRREDLNIFIKELMKEDKQLRLEYIIQALVDINKERPRKSAMHTQNVIKH